MEREGFAPGRYSYETPWPAFALGYSSMLPKFRLGIGSCIPEADTKNHIQVVTLDDERRQFDVVCEATNNLPQTKLMFVPDNQRRSGTSDVLASIDTNVHLWLIQENSLKRAFQLTNKRPQPATNPVVHKPPLTSFDWNEQNLHKLGASSVDTTCTIWNLEQQKVETQLIAHDKPVLDIAFNQAGSSLFGSVGADGSIRLFDQRKLDHSTIIFETSPTTPLLRLAWNKLNPHHVASIAMDQPGVILVDLRRPSVAFATLTCCESTVNHIAWAPHSKSHLLCGTNDGQALIWDITEIPSGRFDGKADTQFRRPPLVTYDTCFEEVYQVAWPSLQPDYVALGGTRHIEVLHL